MHVVPLLSRFLSNFYMLEGEVETYSSRFESDGWKHPLRN